MKKASPDGTSITNQLREFEKPGVLPEELRIESAPRATAASGFQSPHHLFTVDVAGWLHLAPALVCKAPAPAAWQQTLPRLSLQSISGSACRRLWIFCSWAVALHRSHGRVCWKGSIYKLLGGTGTQRKLFADCQKLLALCCQAWKGLARQSTSRHRQRPSMRSFLYTFSWAVTERAPSATVEAGIQFPSQKSTQQKQDSSKDATRKFRWSVKVIAAPTNPGHNTASGLAKTPHNVCRPHSGGWNTSKRHLSEKRRGHTHSFGKPQAWPSLMAPESLSEGACL